MGDLTWSWKAALHTIKVLQGRTKQLLLRKKEAFFRGMHQSFHEKCLPITGPSRQQCCYFSVCIRCAWSRGRNKSGRKSDRYMSDLQLSFRIRYLVLWFPSWWWLIATMSSAWAHDCWWPQRVLAAFLTLNYLFRNSPANYCQTLWNAGTCGSVVILPMKSGRCRICTFKLEFPSFETIQMASMYLNVLWSRNT